MAATVEISLHLPGPLRVYSGGASKLTLGAGTVHDALQQLEREHEALYRNICDETGRVRRHLNLFVNSDHIRDLDGMETKLAAGDVLTVLPAVSGG